MPEQRRCSHCHEVKTVDAFSWRNQDRGIRAPNCRACQKEYNRRHYLANKALYKARAVAGKSKARRERTLRLLEYFEEHPCVDCGEADPVVLEFDHLRDKDFDVSRAVYTRRWTTVLAEIEKCEVVCANCHRRRTSTRLGAIRVLLTESGRRESNSF